MLAKRIAERGGNLILLNRKSAHSEKARDELQKLSSTWATQIDCDLSDFASVRKAAGGVRSELERKAASLDCLVLNAGLMAQSDTRTKDGYDVQMQANHLSHFLLASLLVDLLHEAASRHGDARVVSHSSGARHSPDEPLREEGFEQAWAEGSKAAGDANTMAKWVRYQQSKRANLAFTYALADVLAQKAGNKVKAVCAHPGATNSGLQAHTDAATYMDRLINGARLVHDSTGAALPSCSLCVLCFAPHPRLHPSYTPPPAPSPTRRPRGRGGPVDGGRLPRPLAGERQGGRQQRRLLRPQGCALAQHASQQQKSRTLSYVPPDPSLSRRSQASAGTARSCPASARRARTRHCPRAARGTTRRTCACCGIRASRPPAPSGAVPSRDR